MAEQRLQSGCGSSAFRRRRGGDEGHGFRGGSLAEALMWGKGRWRGMWCYCIAWCCVVALNERAGCGKRRKCAPTRSVRSSRGISPCCECKSMIKVRRAGTKCRQPKRYSAIAAATFLFHNRCGGGCFRPLPLALRASRDGASCTLARAAPLGWVAWYFTQDCGTDGTVMGVVPRLVAKCNSFTRCRSRVTVTI